MEVNVKLTIRKVAVALTALALGASFPVLSSADQGGIPHSQKPCKPKKNLSKKKHQRPNNNGKKCGWGGPNSTTAVQTTTSIPTTTVTTNATP
jgi:hypothetical protein